jgi:hypothetical protein
VSKRVRASDLKTALAALRAAGIEPAALDMKPDGSCRWHFTQPVDSDDNDLDRELAEFDRKHGYG